MIFVREKEEEETNSHHPSTKSSTLHYNLGMFFVCICCHLLIFPLNTVALCVCRCFTLIFIHFLVEIFTFNFRWRRAHTHSKSIPFQVITQISYWKRSKKQAADDIYGYTQKFLSSHGESVSWKHILKKKNHHTSAHDILGESCADKENGF